MLPDLSKYEKYIDLTPGRLRYYELGEGGDNTLFIHGQGIQTSSDTFQFVLEDFAAQGLKVYALDVPGYGKSIRKMPYGPTFDIVVDGIREFIDVKGIAPTNLVGHSAGGWWGAILAYQSPERLKKLVMVGSAGMNVDPSGGSRVGKEDQLMPEQTKESALVGVSRSFIEGSSLTPELGEEMAEQLAMYANMPGARESLMPITNQMGIPEARRFVLIQRMFPYIKNPTMVIWGTGGGKPISDKYPEAGQGDTMDPFPTWTAEWEKTGGDLSKSSKPWVIPGAKYYPMPTGHNVHWEQPKEFVKVVSEFLKN
jgi:pimeloyl-ACP methyl ester carboxylesterase